MALEDPLTFLFTDLFGYTSTFDAYIYFDLARFLALFTKDEIIKNRYLFGTAFGFMLFLHFLTQNTPSATLINTFIHFSILLKLLQMFVQEMSFQRVVSVFLLVLIFYQINTVLKFIILMAEFSDLFYYFIVSSAAQCLIAIFFVIFRDNDKRLMLQTK